MHPSLLLLAACLYLVQSTRKPPAHSITDQLTINTSALRRRQAPRSAKSLGDIGCRPTDGTPYSGAAKTTESGRSCQVWSANSPHTHGYTGVGDHNHCRNPDGAVSLWCYTTDLEKARENCDVPACPTYYKVINFSGDNDDLPDSDGKYTGASLAVPDLPRVFTFCTAFMVETWTTGTTEAVLWQLKDESGDRWAYISMYASQTYTEFEVSLGKVSLVRHNNRVLFPLTWTHVCLSLDSASGRLVLVVDGEVLEESVQQEVLEDNGNRPVNLSVVLGYNFATGSEYTGITSMLNIFSSSLSTNRMVAVTSAGGVECGAPGDLLSWEEAEWQLTSGARIELVVEEPCRRESDMTVYSADFQYQIQCMDHCPKIGSGRSPPVRTQQEWERLRAGVHAITPDIKDLPWLWIGSKDETEEGVWTDHYDPKSMMETGWSWPWQKSGNDTIYDETYNCMAWWTSLPDDKCWTEWECRCRSSNNGCPCQYQQQPILRLRGVCRQNSLDTLYTPKQLPDTPNQLLLLGQLHTSIQYNDSSSQWTLTDAESSVKAVSRASWVSYTLGKHTWMVTGDVFNCHEGQPYETLLKMSGCIEGEFTCDDGQCVTMQQRCNQIPNCRDKSDEVDCKLLILENNYNRKVPPIISTGGDNFDPTLVDISIDLLKIVDMEETYHKISFQFQITMEWRENDRVVFHNLKQDTSLNALTDDDINQLWLPRVIYDNTDQKQQTRVGAMWEWSTLVSVIREGNFTRSDIDVLDEIEIFEGEDNSLSMEQVYTWEFQCKYHLHYYPFDTQVCTIEMTIGRGYLETVMLLPYKINMRLSPSNDPEQDPVDLPLFMIIGWELTQRNIDCPEEGIRMVAVLRRKPWREVMTTYLPTILLMVATYITTFFKPEFFEAAVGVNMTTMLMMTTIFMNSLAELTDTAYAKWIDFWLIFCQLVPLIEVVILTLKEAYRQEEEHVDNVRKLKVTHMPATPLEDQVLETRVPVQKAAWLPQEDMEGPSRRGKLFWCRVIEKNVLPGFVLLFALAYFFISISHYAEIPEPQTHVCTEKI